MAIPTDVDGTWVDLPSAQLNAGELRRADAAIFAGAGSAFGVAGGIVRHGDTSLSVTVDGSDVVTIQPGAVVIPGNAVSGTGCYRFGLSAAITGALTARNATNPRIDLVVARQMDDDVVTSHDAWTGRFSIVAGTPAASPTVPALPSMAVELGRISVPATGGGAASVDLTHRTFAAALGAEIAVPTASMLPAAAAKYQHARAIDTGVFYQWDGSAWDDGTWKTYTPTLSGLTVGNGSLIARYRVLGNKTVVGRVRFIAGSTSSYSGTLAFGIPPVQMLSTYDATVDSLGSGNVNNNTSSSRSLVTTMPNVGLTQFLLALNGSIVTGTNPFTFGTSSRIGFEFRYEAA